MSTPTFSTCMFPHIRKRVSCWEWVIGNPDGHHVLLRIYINRRFPRDYR